MVSGKTEDSFQENEIISANNFGSDDKNEILVKS